MLTSSGHFRPLYSRQTEFRRNVRVGEGRVRSGGWVRRGGGLVLFLVVVLVDLAGLGRGLAVNGSGVGAVGLGDGGGHSGGVAQLDGLVVHLVGGGQGQHGEDSDEGLKDNMVFVLDSHFSANTSHYQITHLTSLSEKFGCLLSFPTHLHFVGWFACSVS